MVAKQSERPGKAGLPSGRTYLYRQLADQLREAIGAGRYRPGARLPSLDDLAAHHRLNRITVIKALAELRREGLVRSVPAQGTYVSETPPAARARQTGILTVGLISHVLHPAGVGPYHAQVINGIQDELGKANGLLVVTPAAHLEPQSRIFEVMSHANLDAVIFLGPFDPPTLRQMVKSGPPSVLIDFQLRGMAEDAVLVDNRGGGFQAIEHLLGLGHRDIAVVTGPGDQVAVQERLVGAREAMAQAGLELAHERVVPGLFTRESGAAAMAAILKAKHVPTAVFCMNDEMAVGALHALQARSGLRVPDDLSLIGFDDIPSATATSPYLSTIHVETQLMGCMAVQRLIAKLNDPGHRATTTIIPTRLIARGSTAAVAPHP